MFQNFNYLKIVINLILTSKYREIIYLLIEYKTFLCFDNFLTMRYIGYINEIRKKNDWQNKKGFTLAEVLITLVIIGVVVAMTIPNVINNSKKQEYSAKFKKFYSTMKQA